MYSLPYIFESYQVDEIFEINPLSSRQIPYDARYHIIITYEVEKRLRKYVRDEIKFASWIAEIVGFWAVFALWLKIINIIDDVQIFVISDLVQPYKSKFLNKR